MTIASEISRLQGVKADIISAIQGKGVDVPSGTMLGQCPALIDTISGGGSASAELRAIKTIHMMAVVDENGYIGIDMTGNFQLKGSGYALDFNWCVCVSGVDFSGSALGQVEFVDIADDYIGGRKYRTVTIGGKVWMAENLDFKFSGLNVGQSGTSSTEPRANYYNDSEATYGVNGNKYGLLYNWIAVKYLNDNRATLIPGWHVPSTSEWDALANAVGGTGVAGTKLKAASGWSSGNGTDNYGFSVFPAGYRYSGSFNDLGSNAGFWTATENSSSNAYCRYFSTGESMGSYSNSKTYYAYSVRLVKDSA